MPKVTIIVPTARFGGLDIIHDNVMRQTYRDFECIVVDELKRSHLPQDKCFTIIDAPEKDPKMYWNLDKSLNHAIRLAKGEVIVLLNDYIWIPDDALERLIKLHEDDRPCLVTGVGHQYVAPPADDPKGLYSVWNPFPGRPSGDKIFTDPRVKGKGVYICTPVEWEGNWACFAKEIWEKIGGFDEEFDAGWGYDNVNFAERAQLAGFNTFLDLENECFGYSHIKLFSEEKARDSAPNNQPMWYKKYQDLHYRPETAWKLDYAYPKG